MPKVGIPPGLAGRVFVATFLWGTAFPVNKLALSHLQPYGMGGLRFLLSGLLLLSVSQGADFLRKGRLDISPFTGFGLPGASRVLLIAFLGNALFYGFFYSGMSRTSASSAAVADGSGPVISAVLAHFLLAGDRLNWRKLIALALAFAGVVVVAFSRAGQEAGASAVGCGLILVAMFFGSLGTMLVVRYRGRLGLMKLVGLQHFLGGAMLLGAALVIEGAAQFQSLSDTRALIPVLYLSLVSAVAFRVWFGVVREYKVTSVAVFSFLTTIWGAMLSVVLLGEPLSWPLLAGLGLVICAVVVLHGRARNPGEHRR